MAGGEMRLPVAVLGPLYSGREHRLLSSSDDAALSDNEKALLNACALSVLTTELKASGPLDRRYLQLFPLGRPEADCRWALAASFDQSELLVAEGEVLDGRALCTWVLIFTAAQLGQSAPVMQQIFRSGFPDPAMCPPTSPPPPLDFNLADLKPDKDGDTTMWRVAQEAKARAGALMVPAARSPESCCLEMARIALDDGVVIPFVSRADFVRVGALGEVVEPRLVVFTETDPPVSSENLGGRQQMRLLADGKLLGAQPLQPALELWSRLLALTPKFDRGALAKLRFSADTDGRGAVVAAAAGALTRDLGAEASRKNFVRLCEGATNLSAGDREVATGAIQQGFAENLPREPRAASRAVSLYLSDLARWLEPRGRESDFLPRLVIEKGLLLALEPRTAAACAVAAVDRGLTGAIAAHPPEQVHAESLLAVAAVASDRLPDETARALSRRVIETWTNFQLSDPKVAAGMVALLKALNQDGGRGLLADMVADARLLSGLAARLGRQGFEALRQDLGASVLRQFRAPGEFGRDAHGVLLAFRLTHMRQPVTQGERGA